MLPYRAIMFAADLAREFKAPISVNEKFNRRSEITPDKLCEIIDLEMSLMHVKVPR
jgi:hypothetical protein